MTGEPCPVEKGRRWISFLVLVVGISAIFVAAGGALAGASGSTPSSSGSGVLHGADGDDVLTGGDGPDEIYGGPGRDLMFGGAGDDFIEAKDGARDFVDCGPGLDVASIDDADRVAPNCETVYP